MELAEMLVRCWNFQNGKISKKSLPHFYDYSQISDFAVRIDGLFEIYL